MMEEIQPIFQLITKEHTFLSGETDNFLQRREGEVSIKVRLCVLDKLKTSAWYFDDSHYYHYTVCQKNGINI